MTLLLIAGWVKVENIRWGVGRMEREEENIRNINVNYSKLSPKGTFDI